MNLWFVSIIDIHLSQGQEAVECGIQALNILRKSVINNTKTNCLELYVTEFDKTRLRRTKLC